MERNVAPIFILMFLSGCSSLSDSWQCSVMSGHEHVIFETKLNFDSGKMLTTMQKISSKEDLMIGAKDVEIGTINHHYVRKEIELCGKDTQVLADNFLEENSYRIYIRAPRNPVSRQTKRVIAIFSELQTDQNSLVAE